MLQVELPTFAATWWPLRMETIPGSGEAISVAIMVRAASGQTVLRQVVAPSVLSTLFGSDTGKGVQAMLTTTLVSMQRQLDSGVPAEELELPFGGFHLAGKRDGVARDLNETFDVAVRLTCGFGQSAFGAREEAEDSSRKAFDDWAEKVQTELLLRTVDGEFERANQFNVKVKLGQKLVQFGLMQDGYVANFGVLRPGMTSGDMRSLKAKVFDLEALRRDTLFPIEQADILAGVLSVEQLSMYSRREIETFRNSLEFVEQEAKARDVTFVRCASPAEAVNRIRSRMVA